MNEHENENEKTQTAAPPRNPAEDSAETILAGILKNSSRSNLIAAGLTRPPDPVDFDEPDPELIELGKQRYEARKSEAAEQAALPSEQEIELLETTAARELEEGDDIEAGIRWAERDPQGFVEWVKGEHEDDPAVQEILDEYGATDVADLATSDSYLALSDEDREDVLEQLMGSPAAMYAEEILDQLKAEELPRVQRQLTEAWQREAEAEEEEWGSKTEASLGASHLTESQWDDLESELDGFRESVREGGPDYLRQLIDGFTGTKEEDVVLQRLLTTPLSDFDASDPQLQFAARAQRALASRVMRASRSREVQDRILEHAPVSTAFTDRGRQEHLADRPHKPVLTLAQLDTLMSRDPSPARDGKQVQKDVAKRGRPSVGQEMTRLRKSHEKHVTEERAREARLRGGR